MRGQHVSTRCTNALAHSLDPAFCTHFRAILAFFIIKGVLQIYFFGAYNDGIILNDDNLIKNIKIFILN